MSWYSDVFYICQSDNSKFTLSLEGEKKDAFSVNPPLATSKADVRILMKNPAEVDYEVDKSIILTVSF